MNLERNRQFTSFPQNLPNRDSHTHAVASESAVRRSPRLMHDPNLSYAPYSPESMNGIPIPPQAVATHRHPSSRARRSSRHRDRDGYLSNRTASRRSHQIEWYDPPQSIPDRTQNEDGTPPESAQQQPTFGSEADGGTIRPPDATLRSTMLLPPLRGSSVWDAPTTADDDLERAMEASREAYYNHRLKIQHTLDRQKRMVSVHETLLRTLRTRLSWWNRFSAPLSGGESASVWEILERCIDRFFSLSGSDEPISEEDLTEARSALALLLADDVWKTNEALLRFRSMIEDLLEQKE